MLRTPYNCALSLLALREHSKTELLNKLLVKGFNKDEIAVVLQNLEKNGLQNDERFAENYTLTRSKHGFGPIRIEAELHERGIETKIIKKVLAELEITWEKLAKEIRCKKFGQNIPTDLKNKTKQMRYLYYKGFSSSTIKDILK
jgi:regulatory protein